jgi:hypothetical protein
LEQIPGIAALYAEFFRGYGAVFGLFSPDFASNSTYNQAYTRSGGAVMRIVPRVLLTLILVAITAFCCFGFLASFEPPGFLVFRWLYGAVAVACVVGIVTLWLAKTPRR